MVQAESRSSFFISIPKINVISTILPNIDASNEKEYREVLKKGIAHAKGTALPGEKGIVYLFAHSSGPPWELTRYNTIFFRLGELSTNDEIVIEKDGKKYLYKVTDKKVVWPQDTTYLLQKSDKDQLVLQTCYPIGTDLQRLLVIAIPKPT